MARFQTLPDRIDCICVSVPDRQMCQNNGITISCNLTINQAAPPSQTKRSLDVTSTVGSCSWTVPTGITSIFIEIWGAGGGGGGNGNCCCCTAGPGGGGGGYVSVTIPTAGGCVYIACAGSGGTMGCGQCTNGGTGNVSYVTGYNLTSLCATGGCGALSGPCNACSPSCYGTNWPNCSFGCPNSTAYVNNAICACGEGGHLFGHPKGCRFENKGGSSPMNGGTGAMMSLISCCPYMANCGGIGGDFPGGGGSGAPMTCCCGICNCGGCGASGLVRIWY